MKNGSTAALLIALVLVPSSAHAGVSLVLRFDALDAAGPNGGDWYKDSNNESGTLAWGESYVMMAYAQMYGATGEQGYLDKLAEHADGVIAQRDDARGVPDYTGTANPCWQATRYSSQPMCWAVHSGMLTYPMAMLAAHVAADSDLAASTTYDGTTFTDKAAAILSAVVETYDFHESEWRDVGSSQGHYIFPPDATFYSYAGDEMPLNQMNGLGRTAVALWLATGEARYLERATRLANHLMANLQVGSGDTYVWNYWGGAYSAPGEDISHAAISVGLAALCASHAIVFDDADMERFGRTFYENVVIDNHNSHDNVGGGPINGDSYRPQMGRWAILGAWDPRATAAVRNLYETYSTVSSGSVLLGFAYLARHEYFIRPFTFYHVDWNDLGDRRQATAYGANVLTLPPDPTVPVFYRMTYEAFRSVEVEEWDGSAYHGVLNLATTTAPETVFVAYDPRWWFLYTSDGSLFQFNDAFVSGQGVTIYEPEDCEPPAIDSSPPRTEIAASTIYAYTPSATGAEPRLWFLDGPPGATVGRDSGAVLWTADPLAGDFDFSLEVQNDCGSDLLAWTVTTLLPEEEPEVEPPDTIEPLEPVPDAADASSDTSADVPQDDSDPTPWSPDQDGGCGCSLVV